MITTVTIKGKQYQAQLTIGDDLLILAELIDVKGAHTQGESPKEAIKNLVEVAELVFEAAQ